MATQHTPDSAVMEAGRRALLARRDSGRGEEDIVLIRARGSFVWDSAGRRYLDCISQAWSVNIGHCHPRVIAAAERQARELTQVRPNFANVPIMLLAKRLAELAPGRLKRVAFSLHGSTAMETAMKAGYAQ